MAVLLFAVLIFRIWFLQILSGDQYVAMAEDNRTRFILEEAPRGIIYDRNKVPLVENRAGLAVTVFPPALKDPEQELAELSQIIGVPLEEIHHQLDLHKEDTYRSVVVKKDITPEMKSYLIERIPLYFPGVDIKKFPLRDYPNGTEAAHVLGHVGQIDEQELAEPRYEGYKAGDEIGKDGVEFQFDKYLKGIDGGREVEVDAAGRPKSDIRNIKSQPGNNVVLTIDSKIQKATEDALDWGIDLAHQKNYPANGAAAVVMNPKTGEVCAMASLPTYDPKVWVGGMSDAAYQQLTQEGANDPLLNRAIAGPVSAGFHLQGGDRAWPDCRTASSRQLTDFTCTGVWDVLSQPFKCWGAHGDVDLKRAIIMSCDTYFYNVGYRFYKANSQGMQNWARQMGLGKETGIDLPGEAVGRIPDPEWKARVGRDRDRQDVDAGQQRQLLHRPGRHPDHAAADGLGLFGDRQRRPAGQAARGPAGRGPGHRQDGGQPASRKTPCSCRSAARTCGRSRKGWRAPRLRARPSAILSSASRRRWPARPARPRWPARPIMPGTRPTLRPTIPSMSSSMLIEQGGGGGSVAAPTARKMLEALFPQPPSCTGRPAVSR